MTTRSYEPYRGSLLTKSELAVLSRLRPAIAVRDTLFRWGTIILLWASVAWANSLLWLPVAAVLIATQVYALIIIAHDGLHRRLFASVEMNDRWNDWAILGAIGAITRVNRHNHMTHHRALATSEDPDSFKYLPVGRESIYGLAWSLTGVPLVWRAARNVMNPSPSASTRTRERHCARDIVLLVLWQVTLIAGLSWTIGWWAYPALWLLPLGMALVMDMARVFCEHSLTPASTELGNSLRLSSFTPTIIERIFLAPHNMNHHVTHHLWPSIPYYNLPAAEAIAKCREHNGADIEWRTTYMQHLMRYAEQLRSAQ